MKLIAILCFSSMALAATAEAAVAAQPTAGEKPTHWRMASEYPASTMPGEGLAEFAKEVNARTAGTLDIEASYDGSAGIPAIEIPLAVRDGRLEAGDAYEGALAGLNPIFSLSSLPFVTNEVKDAQRLADLARPLYAEAFEQLGQHLLYVTPWPASGLWSTKPIANADVLRTLSIRTYDATSAKVMQTVGARAQALSFAEVPARLENGSINAVLSSGDGAAGQKLLKWLPYFTTIEYAMPLSFATVNKKAYAALSAKQKRAVDQAAEITEFRQWLRLQHRAAQNRQHLQELHVAVDEPSAPLHESLRIAAQQAILEWERAAGPQATAVLEQFRHQGTVSAIALGSGGPILPTIVAGHRR